MTDTYEERYCAFVDILGFRQLVQQVGHGTTKFDAIKTLLNRVHNPSTLANLFSETDFRVQSISDAVAISTKVTPNGLTQIFDALESLAQDLLFEGFFIRGAVVKGKLYHDDHMVFGDALISAFQLESEIVRYPRIMVTRDIAKDIVGYNLTNKVEIFLGRLIQANDGPRYLHVLQSIERAIKEITAADRTQELYDNEDINYYLHMKEMIQKRFYESQDNPRHFEKVQWFAAYWNRHIPRLEDGSLQLHGPGAIPAAAVWG